MGHIFLAARPGLWARGRCVAHAGMACHNRWTAVRTLAALHNSTGPGQRCSVGCSQRYQPTPNTAEQRKAQDHTFEALRHVYFCDAWRAQPVLNAPCRHSLAFWFMAAFGRNRVHLKMFVINHARLRPRLRQLVLQWRMRKQATIVSVLSSPSDPSTLPSAVLQEEADSPMEDKDGGATSSDEEGDCLCNSSSSNTRPANEEMLEENGEESTTWS